MAATIVSKSSTTGNRFYALDALRGLAILAMILSSEMPEGANSLPAWMYHAQVPPPEHRFIPFPGITWVDLVFPFFLFSMGAAFPLALGRRLADGVPECKIAAGILKRGFLLAFFAFFVIAIRPYVLSDQPTTGTWFLALAGFVILFPILMRLPETWSAALRWSVRVLGWLAALIFLGVVRYPDGSGFSVARSDIIIVVLANMAVFGGLIWVVTRRNLLARLGVIGIVLAIRLSNMPHPLGGWVTDFWTFSPTPWIYKLYYLQYLCIVLPGTIAGDLVVQWTSASSFSSAPPVWSGLRRATIALLMLALILVMLIGLKSRWTTATPLVIFGMCFAGWFLLKNPASPTEHLYRSLFSWGIYWMVLGLFLEPYEGGIRKDKATISYYFVTAGLANGAIIALSILIDACKKRRVLNLLIQTGQNPMIAYAGVNNFINPLLALTGAAGLLDHWADTPWRGFFRGLFVTLLIALVTAFLTRRKIFWRT
jgi:predicted acyltransferase